MTSTQNAEIEVYNPENYTAEPLIKIINAGSKIKPLTLSVNDSPILMITKETSQDHIELDSTEQSAYFNAKTYISCTQFPLLSPGLNIIKLSSTEADAFKTLEIKPNFRRL